jgi:mRNA-degrading endonuclease toxin of MazEF toxin-antitoxin module
LNHGISAEQRGVKIMDVKKFREKLQAAKATVPIPQMKEDPECILESRDLLDRLFKTMLTYDQAYGIKWMMGLDKYLTDKSRSTSSWFRGHLDRGHLVEIELFGHFNRELTFAHPAVVLYDASSEGMLLVAPISTTQYGDSDPLHIDLEVADGVKHLCAVRLDSIRSIDKRRVLYQHNKDGQNCKVRSSKLDQIDSVLLDKFMPVTARRITKLEQDLQTERDARKKAEEEIILLQARIEAAAGISG